MLIRMGVVDRGPAAGLQASGQCGPAGGAGTGKGGLACANIRTALHDSVGVLDGVDRCGELGAYAGGGCYGFAYRLVLAGSGPQAAQITLGPGPFALGLCPCPDGGVGDSSQYYGGEGFVVFPAGGQTHLFVDGAESPYQLGKGALCHLYYDYARIGNGGCGSGNRPVYRACVKPRNRD